MVRSILVVEDESAVRELLVMLIEGEVNFNATGARSGFQALELLRTIKFDLITLDLNMPEIDGNALLQKLCKVTSPTPVIVVSATPQNLIDNSRVKAVVAKPFDIDELMELIQKFSA